MGHLLSLIQQHFDYFEAVISLPGYTKDIMYVINSNLIKVHIYSDSFHNIDVYLQCIVSPQRLKIYIQYQKPIQK